MFTHGLWTAAGIFFIFLMTSLGSAAVFLLPEKNCTGTQGTMMGFSGGVMTAAAVWSLLLPAIAQAEDYPAWLPAAGGLLSGSAFIALLDLWREGHGGQRSMLFAAVTLHNIPEGLAVGLAFSMASDGSGLASAIAMAFGIGVQNFPEGAAVSLPLRQSGMKSAAAFSRGFLSGAVEPMAALLALLLASKLGPFMPWLLSFAAGAMLHVSAGELLHEAKGLRGTFAYMLGFMLMMVLDVALG